MTHRILVDVDRILDATATREDDAAMYRALQNLACEINDTLDEYETTLVHLDTRNFLAFTRRPDPEEGEFWRERFEDDQDVAEALAELMED